MNVQERYEELFEQHYGDKSAIMKLARMVAELEATFDAFRLRTLREQCYGSIDDLGDRDEEYR